MKQDSLEQNRTKALGFHWGLTTDTECCITNSGEYKTRKSGETQVTKFKERDRILKKGCLGLTVFGRVCQTLEKSNQVCRERDNEIWHLRG